MIDKINSFGKKRTPFLFIIDYENNNPIIIPLDEIDKHDILFDIRGFNNNSGKIIKKEIKLEKFPIPFKKYKQAFDKVIEELKNGNSYLLNLTFPTKININLSLKEIFYISNAKYKLYYNNQFTVFSPEPFVEIKNNIISSRPMKGTINASVPDAEKIILNDEKEFAEHITIVDLIRNDLGIHSKKVVVDNFRYVEKINAYPDNLLQISSKISGELENNWQNHLGEILFSLLPAGSVTGAPKTKTVEIIKRIENYDRGYYTGIFGYFNSEYLDSGVMIRFIERKDEDFFYKSGGGITVYSDAEKEYKELIDKIYVPID